MASEACMDHPVVTAHEAFNLLYKLPSDLSEKIMLCLNSSYQQRFHGTCVKARLLANRARTSLNTSFCHLRNVQLASLFPNLHTLRLQHHKTCEDAEYEAFCTANAPSLSRVTSLALADIPRLACRPSTSSSNVNMLLGTFPALRSLELDAGRVVAAGGHALRHLAELRSLRVSGCFCMGETLQPLGLLTRLTHLDVHYYGALADAIDVLQRLAVACKGNIVPDGHKLPPLPPLRLLSSLDLDVGFDVLGAVTAALATLSAVMDFTLRLAMTADAPLQPLARLTALRTLAILDNGDTSCGHPDLQDVWPLELPQLTRLTLQRLWPSAPTPTPTPTLRHLVINEAAPLALVLPGLQLTWLQLTWLDCDDVEVDDLRAVAAQTRLRGLAIYDNCGHLYDVLSVLSGLKKLRQLELSGWCGDDEALAPIRQLTQLHHVTLAAQELTDAGVALLGYLSELRSICLEDQTLVSSYVLVSLARLPRLTSLTFDGCKRVKQQECDVTMRLHGDQHGRLTVTCKNCET